MNDVVRLACVRCNKEVTPLILKKDGLVCESCERKEGRGNARSDRPL